MKINQGLVTLAGRQVGEVIAAAINASLAVYYISTKEQAGVGGFFDSVRSNMPLDPPMAGENWNALNDSLTAGIAGMPAPAAIIIWNDSANLRNSNPAGYEVAMTSLARISEEVANPERNEYPKKMWVFVDTPAGEYGQFPHEFTIRGAAPGLLQF